MMRNMEPVNSLDADKTDERTAGKRTDGKSHVQSDIIVGRTQIDEVTRTNGNDSAYCHNPEQTTRDVENHGESHSRNGCCRSITNIVIVWYHRYRLELAKVEIAQFQEEGNTERHGYNHQKGVNGSRQSHLYVVVEHIVHEVYQWHARYDKQRTGKQRMERCARPCVRKPCGKESKERADKSSDRDADIVVETTTKQPSTQIHTDGGSKRRIEESSPVATELNAEATARKTSAYSHL